MSNIDSTQNILTKATKREDLYPPRYTDAPLNAVLGDDTLLSLTPKQLELVCDVLEYLKVSSKEVVCPDAVLGVDSYDTGYEYKNLTKVVKSGVLSRDMFNKTINLNLGVISPRNIRQRLSSTENVALINSMLTLHPYSKHILNVKYYMSTDLLELSATLTKHQRTTLTYLLNNINKVDNTTTFNTKEVLSTLKIPQRQLTLLLRVLIANNIILPINNNKPLSTKSIASDASNKQFIFNPDHAIKAVSNHVVFKYTYSFVSKVLNTDTEVVSSRVFEVTTDNNIKLFKVFKKIENANLKAVTDMYTTIDKIASGDLPESTPVPRMTRKDFQKIAAEVLNH